MEATNFNAKNYLDKIKEANPNTYREENSQVFVGTNQQEIKGFVVIHHNHHNPSIMVVTDKYMHSAEIIIKSVKRYQFYAETKVAQVDIYDLEGKLVDSISSRNLKAIKMVLEDLFVTYENQNIETKDFVKQNLAQRFTDLTETKQLKTDLKAREYYAKMIAKTNLNFD